MRTEARRVQQIQPEELLEASSYKDGRLHGKHQEWHSNGQLSFECKFEEGEKIGVETAWHEQGVKISHYTYSAGFLEGECTEWDRNGQIKWTHTYHLDSRDGPFTEWYSNGTKKELEEGTYRADVPGLYTSRYENGQMEKQCFYIAGKNHGK